MWIQAGGKVGGSGLAGEGKQIRIHSMKKINGSRGDLLSMTYLRFH